MRFFNVAGPVCPDDHYAVPPLDRMDVEELLAPIRARQSFGLHAPRQIGKTSALIALRDLLNSGKAGDFRCVDVNAEAGQREADGHDGDGLLAKFEHGAALRGIRRSRSRTASGEPRESSASAGFSARRPLSCGPGRAFAGHGAHRHRPVSSRGVAPALRAALRPGRAARFLTVDTRDIIGA